MTVGPEDDIAAAEYALGTLPPEERAVISARRRREPELDSAIRGWESRLSPLAEKRPCDRPARRLSGVDPGANPSVRFGVSAAGGCQIVALRRSAARWRATAIAASAVAALLAVGFGVRERGGPPAPREYVAVLEEGGSALPSGERERGIELGRRRVSEFLVTVDLDTMELTVRPIRAQAPSGKSYELWLINEKLGAPRPLGVIGDAPRTESLAGLDRALVASAEYDVTVEPAGGSPNGEPSGPAVFAGKLVPATP